MRVSGDMMASTPPSTVYFFGNEFPHDDLRDLFRSLVRHAKDRRFSLVAAFVRESTRVLRAEIDKLPKAVRDEVPYFESILHLPDHGMFRESSLGAAMESAFLVALQVGMFIGHHESHGLDLGDTQGTSIASGLSIGLFSGAAVATARTLGDLVKTGVESLRVAFRLGVFVQDFSQKLESPHHEGTQQSWAHVVTGLSKDTIEGELAPYNDKPGVSPLSKVFISAADKASVGVTGPPSHLRAAFLQSQPLRHSRSLALPVYDGVCHAQHIYSHSDIEAVLGTPVDPSFERRKVCIPLISSQHGTPFDAATGNQLLQSICTELLTGTIYMDNISNGIVQLLEGAEGSSSPLFCTFRTSIATKSIVESINSHLAKDGLSLSMNDLVSWTFADQGPRQPASHADAKLAIVGVACRMPGGANDPEQFWSSLEKGYNACVRVPEDRFDLETHFDPTGETENASQTEFGNFIDRPGYFDAGFFAMSPKEAEQTDPMMRLALVTAYEAMEMAGVVPGRTTSSSPSRIGTYFGQASDDWRELNASQNIGTYAVPGGVRGFTTGRINFFNKYSGPSFNIDTACSSSMAAVQAGCTALWSGEVDTVVAGGVNVITDPDNYAGLCNAYFLSKTGQCKVWDKSADGYCRAEGIGSVVIKRLEDAQADNDNVLAVILSAATNHSADAISITHPHAGAQKTNYRTVLQRAGVHPFDVSYVEMHGTGTQAGDAIESESVLDTFAPTSPRRRLDQPLHLGAVKSNIGHGEAAAGISSLIKAILCFQHERIPPHIGITTEINPAIPKDLDRRNVSLAGADTTWSRSSGHRTAMVNSFGASGGNTTLLLEDGPSKTVERQSSTRTSHAIIISAKSRISLRGNIESLCDYLDQHPDTDLGSLSYTLCARRIHHNLRLATTVTSISALQKFLRSKLDTDLSSVRPVSGDKPSVIFAFTGQGAAYAGSPSLMKESITFRQQILQLDGIVQRQGFSSVLSIVEGTSSEEYASHPVVSQLAIVVLEIAVARYWTELGMHPSAVIGHSLGEYAAMVVSGILSASDAIFLVGRRAQLTMEKCTLGSYAMLSVRAEQGTIESTLKNNSGGRRFAYEVACRNGETDIVLGAPKDDIAAMSQILQAAGHKCTELAMPFAFHTTQMDAVVDDLHALASDIPFHASSVPYISSLLGEVVFDHKTIDANYLKRQTRETVNFVGAVQAATEVGVASAETVWIDIGPHPILAGLIKTILPGSNPLSSNRRNEDTVDTLTKSLVQLHAAGLEPAWGEHFRGQEHGYSMLDLPKYSWNEVNYWIPYRGTWTLEKALLKYGQTSILPAQAQSPAASAHPTLRTSLVHETLFEEVNEDRGTLRALSYMHHPDFRKAVEGHTMNGHGVATSSIWSEMALSIGQYLLQRLGTDPKSFGMDLANFEVLHGQVLNKDKNAHQAIIVNASLNMSDRSMTIDWSSVQGQDLSVEPTAFASGIVYFDDVEDWKVEWSRVNHLVNTQIATLEIMASEGRANQLSKNLAYTLFKNVVDYAPEYRGMDRVVMNEYEAFADITLSNNRGGTWHTPPHWIDSVAHLAGLVMNGSDASDTATYFFVTPGSESLRISKPLEAGGKYRSYVRMFPVSGDPSMHAGDVYILQDEKIIGLLRQIRFRRVHRLLMDRFFSPPSASANSGGHSAPNPPAIQASNNAVPHAGRGAGSSSRQQRSKPQGAQAKAEVATPPEPIAAPVIEISATKVAIEPAPVEDVPGLAVSSASSSSGGDSIQTTSSTVSRCLDIIARETNIDVSTLTADAEFPALGIDSLLSLVLSEKFRAELGLDVKSSLFLECPTVGEMTAWLEQYS